MVNYNLNHEIYEKSSLEKAIKDYSSYCSIKTLHTDKNNTEIEIILKEEYKKDSEQIKNEFLNYVLDLSIKNNFEVN